MDLAGAEVIAALTNRIERPPLPEKELARRRMQALRMRRRRQEQGLTTDGIPYKNRKTDKDLDRIALLDPIIREGRPTDTKPAVGL